MSGKSSNVIAGCFAMASFAVAVLSGLFIDNPASAVLGRALVCMLLCYPVGLLVGLVCQRVVTAHIDAHRMANPAEGPASLAPGGAPGADEEAIVV